MTLQELAALCREANGLDGEVPTHLYLTVPRTRLPRGENIRLAGRHGPLGRICTVKEEGDAYLVVAVFNRQEILAFIGPALDQQKQETVK